MTKDSEHIVRLRQRVKSNNRGNMTMVGLTGAMTLAVITAFSDMVLDSKETTPDEVKRATQSCMIEFATAQMQDQFEKGRTGVIVTVDPGNARVEECTQQTVENQNDGGIVSMGFLGGLLGTGTALLGFLSLRSARINRHYIEFERARETGRAPRP